MKLWLISQDANPWYDTFDSLVVCYETEEEARNHHPEGTWEVNPPFKTAWCDYPSQVKVTYLGEADKSVKQGCVCSSFNNS